MSVFIRRSAVIATIAAVTLGASAPSFARVPSKGQTADGGTVTYNARTGQYCIADTMTGSRLAQQTCKSKEQWAADGLTISGR